MPQSAPATQTLLSPEEEQRAVEAVTALDWQLDPTRGPMAIAEALAVSHDRADAILKDLCVRRILRQRATPANNVAETGRVGAPVKTKWTRDDVATTLEVIRAVTALEWMPHPFAMPLLIAVGKLCDCSIEAAKAILENLRARDILEERPAADGKLSDGIEVSTPRWKWFRVEKTE